jgi:aspartyl-tRNA(Asn)/glutamyl-tRNA(Gln) amidotransferase subunit A
MKQKKTISGTRSALQNQEITASAQLEQSLQNIAERDSLHAYLSVMEQRARAKAAEIDRKVASGDPVGKLAGTVIAIKDNINIRGEVTTCASRILESFKSPFSATVIEKLEAEDAILVGKTNLDEFAMGSSCENSAFAVTRNPVNPEHVAGGSSGGSAVAVAAGTVPVALGSDTGGSIRLPAAYTGVVGLKPTYGRVSRYGLVAFASSLDQIGPFATNTADAARVLSVISGRDQRDATSADQAVPDFESFTGQGVDGLKIGFSSQFINSGVAPEIADSLNARITALEKAGAQIVPVEIPHFEYGIAAYYIIATAEASSNLSRFDGVRFGYRDKEAKNLAEMYENSRHDGFGDEVKRRIMLGTYVLSAGYYDAYYKKAQQIRRLIRDDFYNAFTGVDAIISPTSATTAFRIGDKVDDPLAMYLNDSYTVLANLAGICAISVPAGNDKQGLPIGLQLQAPAFREDTLIRISDYLETMQEQQRQ